MASTIALLSVLRKNRELDETQDAKCADENDSATCLHTLTLAQEARLLIQALQSDEVDEGAFLKFLNAPSDAQRDGDVSESEKNSPRVLRRRLRRIVQHLGLNTVGDEVAPEDVAELKGRLYRQVAKDEKHAGSLAKLRRGFMPNEDVVGALRDRVG